LHGLRFVLKIILLIKNWLTRATLCWTWSVLNTDSSRWLQFLPPYCGWFLTFSCPYFKTFTTSHIARTV
jgi:hypothetical protein